MTDSIDVIIRAIDGIEHPAEAGGNGNNRFGWTKLFAEKLIGGELGADRRLDVLGDGNINRRYFSAVIFKFTPCSAKFAMHELSFRTHSSESGGNALVDLVIR